MNELRRPCIPDVADELPFLHDAPGGEARGRRIEMTEEEDIVAEPPPLANGVTSDDRGSEEVPDVNHVCVADLMFERDERHVGAPWIGKVDPAVTDRVERATAPLGLVGAIEIVSADDEVSAGKSRRHRVAVSVVVRGPVGEARDLLVHRPAPGSFAMRILGRERVLAGLRIARQMNADIRIGERSRGTGGEEWTRPVACVTDDPDPERFTPRASCAERRD